MSDATRSDHDAANAVSDDSTSQHVRVPKWLITAAWSVFLSFGVAVAGAASYWLKAIAEDVHADHALTISTVAQLTDVRERVMRIEGVFLGSGVRHEPRTSATTAEGDDEFAIANARSVGLVRDAAAAQPAQAGAADRVVHGSLGRPGTRAATKP